MKDENAIEITDAKIVKKQESSKWFLRVMHVFNIIFAIIALQMALLSFLIFDSPSTNLFLGFAFIIISFSIPLSIPITNNLMRKNYAAGNVKKVYFYGFFPLIYYFSFAILTIICELLIRLLF